MAVREVEDIFADILDRAKALDPANVRKWFEKLDVAHLSGGSLEIACPDEVTAQFLRDNCKGSFTRAAQHQHLEDRGGGAFGRRRARSARAGRADRL